MSSLASLITALNDKEVPCLKKTVFYFFRGRPFAFCEVGGGGIRLFSVWEQNIDWSGSKSSHRWKKETRDEAVRKSAWGASPSLAGKRLNEVIRINVSHFLLSAGERPQIMVWNSVNTFHWLLKLQRLLMEKSDSLNITQMDVFFVDLCSFMSVSETLYSRKRRIAICYRRNQNQTTVEGLLLVIILKINGRSREEQFNRTLFV